MKRKNQPKKLQPNKGALFYLTLACMLLTASLVVSILANKEESAEAIQALIEENDELDEFVSVPVPIDPVNPGKDLSQVSYTTAQIKRSELSHFVSSIKDLRKKFAKEPLVVGMPILKASITSEQLLENAFATRIPEGMRAITVKVDMESSVEGWARSGNFVDVILLSNKNRLEAKVIAENIKILSAGRSTAPSRGDKTAPRVPQTVTLLLNQEDALKVKAASSLGKITLALRGIGDETPSSSRSISQNDIIRAKGSGEINPFLGKMRGPDGSEWKLTRGNNWVKTKETPAQEKDLSDEERAKELSDSELIKLLAEQ